MYEMIRDSIGPTSSPTTSSEATAQKVPAKKAVAEKAVAEKVVAEKAAAEKAIEEYFSNCQNEAKTPTSTTKNYNVEQQIAEKKDEQAAQVKAKITDLAKNMLQYYCDNEGSLKGFKNTGFPNGITNLQIKTNVGYSNTNNDEFSIGDNGEITLTKIPDDLSITITYNHNGESYTVTEQTTYPWDTPLGEQTEIIGYYNDIVENTNSSNNFGLS